MTAHTRLELPEHPTPTNTLKPLATFLDSAGSVYLHACQPYLVLSQPERTHLDRLKRFIGGSVTTVQRCGSRFQYLKRGVRLGIILADVCYEMANEERQGEIAQVIRSWLAESHTWSNRTQTFFHTSYLDLQAEGWPMKISEWLMEEL